MIYPKPDSIYLRGAIGFRVMRVSRVLSVVLVFVCGFRFILVFR